MKKFTLFLAVIVAAILSSVSVATVSAAVDANECDRIFADTMDGLLEDQGVGNASFTADKHLLYDITLDTLGYLYTYQVDGEDCFTIIVNNRGFYEVTESAFGAVNPYAGCQGLKVYVLPYVYWEYTDEHFVDLETGYVMTDAIVEELTTTAYLGTIGYQSTTETVNYTNRSVSDHLFVNKHPSYYGLELPNACAPIAGGNIVGYFDRYYTNLIPNFTPGQDVFGLYYQYFIPNDTVLSVIQDLYYAMGTNSNGYGTTITQFRSGLTSYVNSKGYNISFYDCMSGGNLNYNNLKTRMNAQMPSLFFVQGFNFVQNFVPGNNSEDIKTVIGTGNHVLTGFGYKEITYTLTNGSTRVDKYVAIATGEAVYERGYLNISSNVSFDAAYAVNIYD